MAFCTNCGRKNADDSRYCENCGSAINNFQQTQSSSHIPNEPTQPQQPLYSQIEPQQPTQPQPSLYSQSEPQQPTQPQYGQSSSTQPQQGHYSSAQTSSGHYNAQPSATKLTPLSGSEKKPVTFGAIVLILMAIIVAGAVVLGVIIAILGNFSDDSADTGMENEGYPSASSEQGGVDNSSALPQDNEGDGNSDIGGIVDNILGRGDGEGDSSIANSTGGESESGSSSAAINEGLYIGTRWYGSMEIYDYVGPNDLEGEYDVWAHIDQNNHPMPYFEIFLDEEITEDTGIILTVYVDIDDPYMYPVIGDDDAYVLDKELAPGEEDDVTMYYEDGVLHVDYYYELNGETFNGTAFLRPEGAEWDIFNDPLPPNYFSYSGE